MENLTFRQTKEATFTTPVVKFTEGELEHEDGSKEKAIQIKGFAKNYNFATLIALGYGKAISYHNGADVVEDFSNRCVYLTKTAVLDIKAIHKMVVELG